MSITVNHLSYIYNKGTPFETKALKNINFTIENGEFVGIMGHTGCGKSTLIQLLAGLLSPSEGQILLDEKDIHAAGYDYNELRRKVGMVFQYPECQLFEMTVEKDIAFGLKHSGLSKQEQKERIRWALEITGFDYEKIRKKSPLGLSGGEKRRIAIAGVLAAKPNYLILDEPIAGLDPLGREAFLNLINKLNRNGMTILMISHNADCLGEYAKRILVLEQGELLKDAPTREVFEDMEMMKQHRLGVSQAREIAGLLQQKGFSISQNISSYSSLLEELTKQLKGGTNLCKYN